MVALKSVFSGIVLMGVVAIVAAFGVALGVGVAAGATVSRRAAAAIGTVLVGFAAAVALTTLRVRTARLRTRISA